jgi:hypothetical protein
MPGQAGGGEGSRRQSGRDRWCWRATLPASLAALLLIAHTWSSLMHSPRWVLGLLSQQSRRRKLARWLACWLGPSLLRCGTVLPYSPRLLPLCLGIKPFPCLLAVCPPHRLPCPDTYSCCCS